MPCVPRTQRRELTVLQKGKILGLLEANASYTEIARQTTLHKNTVRNFCERYRTRGTHENLKRSGAPRLTTEAQDRELSAVALADTRLKHIQVKEQTGSDLSLRSIRRRLRKDGIQKWRAANCAKLTARTAGIRLAWAQRHANWTVEDWIKMCWSDEVSVEKGKDPNAVWVFRRRGEQTKFHPGNVNGVLKGGGVSLMLWSCFISNVKGPLVPIEGRATADTYIELLETHFIPFMNTLKEHGITDAIFQQDNAPIHKAHCTMDYLNQQAFQTMEWPPSSPDMNPIEHLWAVLKKELHQRFPDTKDLPGGPAAVKRALAERLSLVWADIGAEIMEELVASMPRRVAALLAAEGWYTKY
jgi:transposase